MASYFSTLSKEQKDNISFIIKRMREQGIANDFSKTAILSVVSKESSFIPKWESNYSSTSNARIRKIFGARLKAHSETQLTALKKNPEKFFNAVYGGRYGNAVNEGFRYRGGGLNQLTFKNNYAKIGGQIGIDLVANPEKINELPIATDALIQYFLNAFIIAPKSILTHYHTKDINGFKTLIESVKSIYHGNAGWGKTMAALEQDVTGGRKKALDRSIGFLEIVKKTI